MITLSESSSEEKQNIQRKRNFPNTTPSEKLAEVTKLEKKTAGLHLPKLRKLRIRLHREIDWSKVKTITVKREPSGK